MVKCSELVDNLLQARLLSSTDLVQVRGHIHVATNNVKSTLFLHPLQITSIDIQSYFDFRIMI